MQNIAVIQARLGSHRLPNKVLAEIGGQPLIVRIVERLKKCKSIDSTVVATSDNKKDDQLVDLLSSRKINFARGSEENVLQRYYETALKWKADNILRITADNLFIPIILTDKLLISHIQKKAEFSYLENVPVGMGLGMGILSFSCLGKVYKRATKAKDLEHVVTYILTHKNEFKIHSLPAPKNISYPNFRFSIDYPQDLVFIRAVAEKLLEENRLDSFDAEDAVRIVVQNREIHSLMVKSIARSKEK